MPETLLLPKTLNDRYVVERELTRRGMTAVYLARDLRGDRPVAVKVLAPQLVAAFGVDRLLDEIKVAAALQHPHILPIIDSGSIDGSVYCVTSHDEGETLSERLERERQLPLDEALRITGGIAAALDYAHRHGIVHRELEPGKIVLRDGRQPLVADFGLTPDVPSPPEERLSRIGPFAGALAYMSPEQVTGAAAVDVRSNQYSLAAILYEMLAGEPPFAGPAPMAIIAKIVAEPPRRLTAIRVVPRVVERAIERALAKSPAERFPTVGDFVAALHGGGATPSLPTRTSAPVAAPRRRLRVALVASLVVVTVGAGIALASLAVVSLRAPGALIHRQLTFTGTATLPALSPDGRSVLYIGGGRSLVLHELDEGDSVALIPSARTITAARWTGDGKAIVVTMTRDSSEGPATFLLPAACASEAGGCGSPRKVLEDARPFAAGPDSTVIVRAGRQAGEIEIVNLAGGAPARTIALTGPVGVIGEIAWSPDRRWIAFTSARNGALWVVAAGGDLPYRVAGGARTIRWGERSDALYFLSGPAGTADLMRVGIDAQSGRAIGDAARVTSLLAAEGFDVGRDNRLVHTQTSRGAPLRTFVLGGTGAARHVVEERSLSEGTARLDGASISPDGRWVAYSAARGAQRDIHIAAFGGGSARVIAASRALEDAPAWSPDGSRLTFAREEPTGRAVILADARSGSGRRVGSLPGPASPGTAARWSASGRHIAYYAQDRRRIALLNLQRRNESVIRLPEHVGTGHDLVVPSPNGTQLIATTRLGPDEPALWLVFGNGRRWRRIQGPVGEAYPIAWHRNGWIYLVRSRGLATDHGAVHVELWRMRGPTGRPELFAALPEGCGLSVSISADASRGVCSYVHVESDLYVTSNFGAARR